MALYGICVTSLKGQPWCGDAMVIHNVNCRFLALFIGLFLTATFRIEAAGDSALLERLTRIPYIAAVSLSTDGHFLSALKRKGEDASVVVWRADGGFEDGDALPYGQYQVNWMVWIGGGRLLLSLAHNGLVLYDAHLRRLRPLIEEEGPRPGSLPPVLLTAIPDDPSSVLLQWEDENVKGYPAVYKVDVIRGVSQKIISAWKPVVRWWASPEGEVHLGEGFRGRRHMMFSRRADGNWKEVLDRDFFDDPGFSFLALESGGATGLILSSHAGNTRSLWRMDATSGEMLQHLAGHKRFDISAVIVDPVTDLAVGASFMADGWEDVVWHSGQRVLMDELASRLGLDGVVLLSASRDGRRYLYRSEGEEGPPRYYLYDKEEDRIITLPFDPTDADVPMPRSSVQWIPVSKRMAPCTQC